MSEPRYGYMCKQDWDWELGEARHGSIIYPSLKDAFVAHRGIRNCGAVKVRVDLEEVVDNTEISKLVDLLPEDQRVYIKDIELPEDLPLEEREPLDE